MHNWCTLQKVRQRYSMYRHKRTDIVPIQRILNSHTYMYNVHVMYAYIVYMPLESRHNPTVAVTLLWY
jgi:hypothetical protein